MTLGIIQFQEYGPCSLLLLDIVEGVECVFRLMGESLGISVLSAFETSTIFDHLNRKRKRLRRPKPTPTPKTGSDLHLTQFGCSARPLVMRCLHLSIDNRNPKEGTAV